MAQRQAPPVQAVAAGASAGGAIAAPPTTTSTTAAPIVVSIPPTTAVPVTAPPKPNLAPAPAAKTPVTTAPVSTQAPAVTAPRPSGKVESCGWAWDAQRIDDGSYDGVVISLDAPYRPNTPVTITAAPHGPITVPTVRAVMTDGNGQASIEVRLSEDKRDWALTISAAFPTSHCAPQAFTITY